MRDPATWLHRLLWFFLPLTVGQVAADAISSANHSVPQVMTVGLWVLWAAGVVTSMVPVPITLTILRILAPGPLALAMWSMADSDFSTASIVAFIHGVAVLAVALSQLVGDRFADGASYGDERRMLLRAPAQYGYFLAPLTWLLIAAGAVTGPLLLGNHSWVAGILASLAGVALIGIGTRALHQLSHRWIVFVPTGMVLHDLTVVTEPVLFRRTAIERLGAAIAGSPARDLSTGAPGLLLECELTDAAPLGLRDRSGPPGAATMTDVRRFLFSPSRPGELLDEAERRNIPVG